MKISNNALNFLLAQYRAIFKRAYVKGIASAVLLTAGLAAGQAQAANELADVNNLPASGETVYIDGTATATEGHYNLINIVSGTSNSFNGELVIEKGSADGVSSGDNFIVGGIDAAAEITGSGRLTIAVKGSNATDGLLIGGNSHTATVNIGAIDVQNGLLNVTDKAGGSGSVTVAADTINIGGSSTSSKAYLTLTSEGTNTSATLGRVADTQAGRSASQITVGESGVLTMKGSSTSGASILGASLNIAAGGVMLTDNGNANKVLVDDFTVENGAFKVISGSAAVGETFQGHTATVQSGGNFLVGSQGTWTISDTPDTDKNNNNAPITTQVTFEAGSNVQVGGQIVVSGSLLTIAQDAGLHATEPGASGAGVIEVKARGTGTGLTIDKDVLNSFLTSGDAYFAIDKDASGNHTLAETATKDVAGSIFLNQGRLTFSDTDTVELSNFKFATGTSGSAGTIVLQSGANTNVIAGQNISIAKSLNSAGASGNGTNLSGANLQVVTDGVLTLGDGASGGLSKLSDTGVDMLTIRGGLTVNVADNGIFTLDGPKGKVSFTNDDPNVTTEVNGNIEISSGGNYQVRGQWDFNDDVKLSQIKDGPAALIIGHEITKKSNYNTYVTFKGQIINGTQNDGYSGILGSAASNASTVVDLTQATLRSEADLAGMISISASDGAKIKIDGNQFSQILNSKKGNGDLDGAEGFALTASSSTGVADGVIEVTTPVTGEYDFSEFQSKPADGTGSNYENKMTFDNGGILDINGDLGLYTGKKIDPKESGDALDIGSGTIKANQISLTNYHVTDEKNGTYEAVTLKSGTLAVSQGLTVKLSDTLNVGSGSTDVASIVLESDTLTGTGTLAVEDVNLNGKGSIEVHQGAWSTEANIYVKGTGGLVLANSKVNADDLAEGTYAASFVGKNFKAEGTGTAISAGAGTKATFDTMQLSGTSSIALNNGHLLVNGANVTVAEGDKKTDKPYYVNLDANNTSTTAGIAFGDADITVTGAQGVMEFGELATSKLLSLSGDTFTLVKGGIDNANFQVDDFGQLKFNFAENTKLNTKQISSLVNAVKVGDKNDTGYINLGNADLGLNFKDQENGTTTIAWGDLEDYVNVIGSAATSEKLMSAQVTDIAYTDKVKGHYGALSVVTTNNSLALNGPTSLHNAAAFGNNFAVNQNTGELIALRLENGADLNLANGGNVGAIEGGFDNDVIISNDADVADPTTTTVAGGITRVYLLQVGGANDLVVQGNVEALELDVQGTLTNAATANSLVSTNNLQVAAPATLTTNNLTLGHVNGAQNNGTSEVLGTVTVSDTVTLQDGTLALYGGSVSTNDLVLDDGSSIRVGYEPASDITADVEGTDYDETKSYSGVFEAKGTVELNDGYLFVDPAYGEDTALISLNQFKDADTNQHTNIGTMDGSAFVGANSALAVGSESADFLRSKIARFQTNGSLSGEEDGVGAVMYVGNSFTLKQGHGITLTAQSVEDFTDYLATNNVAGFDPSKLVAENTIYLGENTLVMMDAGALERANTSNTTVTPVITFGTTTTGTIVADGGDILVDGQVRAGTYQLVEAGTAIEYIDGNTYAEVTDSTAAHYEDNINVATDNEFLKGVLGANGQVELGVDLANAHSIMSGASDPVVDTLIAYAQGYNGTKDADLSDGDQTDYLYNGYEQTGVDPNTNEPILSKKYNYDNYFLDQVISTGNGAAAEAVARMAVYGGAPQAALKAGQSSTDAIAARFGIGSALSNLTVAGNTQGAALWLAPVYKTSSSDGFDAQGVEYGVDVDLYGVALGADYTLANGMTFGAMFNVGSGEVDGDEAGSSVSNDFDYYGFGAYAGYTLGQFSVVGDISYTVADNEVEASTAFDHLGAQMDSTNLSVGVTGKYELSFNGVNVTPHVGLRFSNIDLDDYTIDGEEVVASADSDKLNLFSIPVGVTIAKEFKGESWTVAPSFDLTLTGQFGDDEFEGSVSWAGVSNLNTDTTTEVIDNFTYGATLGVEAQSVGGIALGINVGYTGSSNVDEFGVNANARFTF